MGHPTIVNLTEWAFMPLLLADEEGRPILAALAKGTFVLRGGASPERAEEQVPVSPAGAAWGDPESSSLKYEPDVAFVKPATDLVLIGFAHAQRAGATEVDVTLKVGKVQKVVRVIGDRCYFKSLGTVSISRPVPFERIPLIYERAFGGWDRSHPDPSRHTFEARNPVGRGYRHLSGRIEGEVPLPNLEDPARPLRGPGDTPPPAGFGFIAPHWQPRAAFAGTYDEAWRRDRMPLLPRDFDRRFFNAAHPDLVVPVALRGNEPVLVLNATPEGRLSFNLPAVAPPECVLREPGAGARPVAMRLDTVVIDAEARRLVLAWRGHAPLQRDVTDLESIEVRPGGSVA